MRIQKPIPNRSPRKQVSSRVHRELRLCVEYAAREYNCSKSFIMAVALAEFFGIKNQELYK